MSDFGWLVALIAAVALAGVVGEILEERAQYQCAASYSTSFRSVDDITRICGVHP